MHTHSFIAVTVPPAPQQQEAPHDNAAAQVKHGADVPVTSSDHARESSDTVPEADVVKATSEDPAVLAAVDSKQPQQQEQQVEFHTDTIAPDSSEPNKQGQDPVAIEATDTMQEQQPTPEASSQQVQEHIPVNDNKATAPTTTEVANAAPAEIIQQQQQPQQAAPQTRQEEVKQKAAPAPVKSSGWGWGSMWSAITETASTLG